MESKYGKVNSWEPHQRGINNSNGLLSLVHDKSDIFSHRAQTVDHPFEIQKGMLIENLIREQNSKGSRVHSNKFCVVPNNYDDNFSTTDIYNLIHSIFNQYGIEDFIYNGDREGVGSILGVSPTTILIVRLTYYDDLLDEGQLKGLTVDIISSEFNILNKIPQSFNEVGFKSVRNLYSRVEDNEIPIKYAFPNTYDIIIQEKSFERLPFSSIIENYSPDVVENYQSVLKSINTNRKGLVVLHGPPGTGKSYLLRALLTDVNHRQGIVCMPAISFLNNVAQISDVMGENKKSLVILEDVGEVLSIEAQIENAPAVSNLLNMTEGFLSFLSDAIFVVTFNYKLENINPALLRPGRCIGRIPVGTLSFNQAKNLVGNIEIPNREYALSEIYNIKNHGKYIEENMSNQKTTGFSIGR